MGGSVSRRRLKPSASRHSSRGISEDNTESAALGNVTDFELQPHMSRKFGRRAIDHIFSHVLPTAIRENNAKVAAACERVLAGDGLAIPNHVSGLWAPLEVPRNEMQVRELFAGRLPEFGFRLVSSHVEFPDWLLLDSQNNFVYTEVEHRSSKFAVHGHDERFCDLVACWEHDWPECPLPVLEFFSGRVIQPAKLRTRSASRAHLAVNFGASLSRYKAKNLQNRDVGRAGYAVKRFIQLRDSGNTNTEACQVISSEMGITIAGIKAILESHLKPEMSKTKPSRREQMRRRFEAVRDEYSTKSAACEAIAAEFGVVPGTVWSNISNSRRA